MAIGVSSKERKPVATVSVGSVAIPIYAAPVTVRPVNGGTASAAVKTYDSFQVAHYEGTRRILQRRNTLDKAKALAKEIASRLSRDGARAQHLSEKDQRLLILGADHRRTAGFGSGRDFPPLRRASGAACHRHAG